eukprot:GSA120T00012860001.1
MGIVSSNVFLEKFVTPEQLKKLPIGTSSSAGSPSRSNTSSTSNGDSPASTTASSDEDIMGAKKQKIEDNIRNSLGIEEDSPRPALVETISTAELRTANGKFDLFTKEVNAAFEKEKIPLKLRNFANTFTLDFKCDSLYNSMFVQHLIANNVFVTNQSTGKFNLLLDWTTAKHDGERKQLLTAFVTAGRQMKERGFFVEKKKMQFFLLAKKFLFSYLRICYDQIMEDKRIDIEVSHNHPVNKFTHFWSSVFMILFAYTYIGYFGWYKEGFLVFLITHVLRQAGHFFYEKQDRNYEKLKFGHKDGSKKAAAVGIAAAIYVFVYLKTVGVLGRIGGSEEKLPNSGAESDGVSVLQLVGRAICGVVGSVHDRAPFRRHRARVWVGARMGMVFENPHRPVYRPVGLLRTLDHSPEGVFGLEKAIWRVRTGLRNEESQGL